MKVLKKLLVVVIWANLSSAFTKMQGRSNDCRRNASVRKALLESDRETIRSALSKMKRIMYEQDSVESSAISNLFKQSTSLCEVRPSLIPGAGMGLFALKNIKQGTIVSLYPVHCLGTSNGDEVLVTSLDDQGYFDHVEDDSYLLNLLGKRPLLSVDIGDTELFVDVNPARPVAPAWNGHFINDGAIIHENSEAGALSYYLKSLAARNCVHVPFGPSPIMAIVTSRKVKKGEELFTSYGCIYWLEALIAQIGGTCTPITDAIRMKAKESAKTLLQARNGISLTYEGTANAFQTLFDN
mmetsp:Transcript_14034/g.18292  ORF Transcript_14034/g.18292 Transcript_14034/m.18292 type:complete len:297 (+) Transcript_14034:126-1016(+)|eukprot:CAMPEP_0198145390 /NCGR_PEP_ID=MMETSP1443-20131203/23112_1 /TAXON_ID=186043 /ORGANISM="Entomoneis sp., Strain CCMP2396" /LENGTH=296 /DNA_ID=CAMNT_0043809021 /DNA_START=99 /DNA_END=989 /DNA_ORIENTATION=+